MILNQSAHYALRAVLFLAQNNEVGAQNADVIAAAIGVPRNYLGKVLHTLGRSRVLTSVRGPHGGFKLAAAADCIPLEAVITPFQTLPTSSVCLLGDRVCNPLQPCGAHAQWRRMSDPVTAFFRETTIASMLASQNGEDQQGVTQFQEMEKS
jgi:Rrf2 family protein